MPNQQENCSIARTHRQNFVYKRHKEEATSNLYWASGLDKYYTVATQEDQWPGENNLGQIYMEIRQKEQDKL